MSLLSPRLPGDDRLADDIAHLRQRHRQATDGLDGVLRVRQRRAQRGVALVEIARQAEIRADVLVVVLGREAQSRIHGIETRERLRPVPVECEPGVEKGVIERDFARGRSVGLAARRTGECLRAVAGDGAARRSTRERVDGEIEAELSFVAEIARGMRAQAQVFDAAVALTVVEKSGIDIPLGLGIGRHGNAGCRVPNKLQVAAASAAPILTSLSAMSVTPAAAAAETPAAAGAFLAEIDVIVERRIERVGIELHVVAREDFALPRLHSEARAPSEADTGKCQQHQFTHWNSFVIERAGSTDS